MKITSIQVDGFGSLNKRHHDLTAGLTVFHGANEAGKSTLLAFIRAVLFGFPPRSQPAERYEPPKGGIHGGALFLEDDQGKRIRVERYAGGTGTGSRSAGSVKVTFTDGSTGGEEELRALMGGLSAELFRSLFAFGLGELQELRTLQSEELSGYLYSAGLGLSGSAIIAAGRKLNQDMDQLYKPRGKTSW
ncbi:AAA family ATPase [Paenibacillus larvae]|nr:AAA family ATPase [Paenibacillus larvae]MDT2236501.1 AAA family ATPase [Paenibacillus larvae]